MKKRVLLIVPFDNIYPPTNGGMQRCFHIIHQLSIHCNVTVVIKQEKEKFLLAGKEFHEIKNIKVYSTHNTKTPRDIFSIFPQKFQKALRYRWYKKNIISSADGNFLLYYTIVSELLLKEKYDTIILESPATLNAVSLIRKHDKKVAIIFDAHNVDSNLAAAFLEKNEINLNRYLSIKKAESSLYKTVNSILVCSNKDKKDFDRLNRNKLLIYVIPNGVKIENFLYDTGVRLDHPKYILFCGFLGARPNSEGLEWFHRDIWPHIRKVLPTLKVIIVGSGCLPVSLNALLQDENFIFTGKVDDVKDYYNKTAISIVPLKTGSGTRLKILEAMSYGIPVVSTSQGAEGIEYTDGKDILIADEEILFAEKIIKLLDEKHLRLTIQQNARELVENKYDWNIIGKNLSEVLNNELSLVNEINTGNAWC